MQVPHMNVLTCLLCFMRQVVEMCWSQQLFDAMIHVYNRGLTDYTTPLLELLLQLRATLKKGKPLPGVHLTSPMSMNIRKCTFTYSPSTGVVTITRNFFLHMCTHGAYTSHGYDLQALSFLFRVSDYAATIRRQHPFKETSSYHRHWLLSTCAYNS